VDASTSSRCEASTRTVVMKQGGNWLRVP
jgi:hypothetical protein